MDKVTAASLDNLVRHLYTFFVSFVRRGRIVVECTGLENRKPRKRFASSNLAPSATLSVAMGTLSVPPRRSRTTWLASWEIKSVSRLSLKFSKYQKCFYG